MEKKIYEKKHPKMMLFMASVLLVLIIALVALDVIIINADYMPGFWGILLFIAPDFGGFNISEGMTRWKPR